MNTYIKPRLIHYSGFWDGPLDGCCEHNGDVFYFKMLEDGWYCTKCNHPKTDNDDELEWLGICSDTKKGERDTNYDFNNYDENDFCQCERYRLYGMYKIPWYSLMVERLSNKWFLSIIYSKRFPSWLWYDCISRLFPRDTKDNYIDLVEKFEFFAPYHKVNGRICEGKEKNL